MKPLFGHGKSKSLLARFDESIKLEFSSISILTALNLSYTREFQFVPNNMYFYLFGSFNVQVVLKYVGFFAFSNIIHCVVQSVQFNMYVCTYIEIGTRIYYMG